jgi:hypothetical protein
MRYRAQLSCFAVARLSSADRSVYCIDTLESDATIHLLRFPRECGVHVWDVRRLVSWLARLKCVYSVNESAGAANLAQLTYY